VNWHSFFHPKLKGAVFREIAGMPAHTDWPGFHPGLQAQSPHIVKQRFLRSTPIPNAPPKISTLPSYINTPGSVRLGLLSFLYNIPALKSSVSP
jgi:hypothetical protein